MMMDEEHADDPLRLGVVAGINLMGFVLELAGGVLFGSIALLSDAFHMLFDALAYAMAFASAYIAEYWERDKSWPFGFHRLETMAAFVNGALLLPMAGYIVYESYERFLSPASIDVVPTLIIASAGLVVNLMSIWYLNDDSMSLNEEGAFYHLMGDTGGSIGVIVAVVVISTTGFGAADPIVAVLIAASIVWSSIKVMDGSTSILLQKTAADHEELLEAVEEGDGVDAVLDLRSWQLCSRIAVATVHVCHDMEDLDAVDEVRRGIRERLHRYGVDYVTIEMERAEDERCMHGLRH